MSFLPGHCFAPSNFVVGSVFAHTENEKREIACMPVPLKLENPPAKPC